MLRLGAVALLAAALVVAGMLVGWRLAGPSVADTELGRFSFQIHPSLRGDAEAFVPVADWGLRADAFDAPFEIRAELRSLERPALARAAEGDLSVLDSVEDDLGAGARAAILRGFAIGAGVALALLVATTLIWRGLRPRWALLAVGVGFTLVGGGLTMWAAQQTFDAKAFESPTYFAQGAELRRILEVAENERVTSQYGSEFASILRSISVVLTEERAPDAPGRDLYLASDLHGNPLVVGPLAEQIGDAPLLFAGDFGQRGGEAEAAVLAPRVAAFSQRVVAVSGNHDSQGLMRRLVSEGVTVLGERGTLAESGLYQGSPLIEVDGLTIAGFPDPFEWPGETDPAARPVTFDDLDDPEAEFDEAVSELVEWFDGLPQMPDIVMVHQSALAEGLAEALAERGDSEALTIVTGHDHSQHLDRYRDVVVVDSGSVGAGGAFDAGREPIGFAELHFSPITPTLRSVDLLEVEPFSGQARASRIVIDALCPDQDRCGFEPPDLDARTE